MVTRQLWFAPEAESNQGQDWLACFRLSTMLASRKHLQKPGETTGSAAGPGNHLSSAMPTVLVTLISPKPNQRLIAHGLGPVIGYYGHTIFCSLDSGVRAFPTV